MFRPVRSVRALNKIRQDITDRENNYRCSLCVLCSSRVGSLLCVLIALWISLCCTACSCHCDPWGCVGRHLRRYFVEHMRGSLDSIFKLAGAGHHSPNRYFPLPVMKWYHRLAIAMEHCAQYWDKGTHDVVSGKPEHQILPGGSLSWHWHPLPSRLWALLQSCFSLPSLLCPVDTSQSFSAWAARWPQSSKVTCSPGPKGRQWVRQHNKHAWKEL